MTRAQRRNRLRKERAASAGLPLSFMSAGHLAENPNRGKRHVAPATARVHSFTAEELERIKSARRDYRPLTVLTPIRRARVEPKFTQYTI